MIIKHFHEMKGQFLDLHHLIKLRWSSYFCAELTLWDEDYNEDDQIGDAVCLPLKNLRLDKPEPRTLKFGEVSHSHMIVIYMIVTCISNFDKLVLVQRFSRLLKVIHVKVPHSHPHNPDPP